MLVLGMRHETWLTVSRCDCSGLDQFFDCSMSKDVVFKKERRGMKLLNHPSHSDEGRPKQLQNI